MCSDRERQHEAFYRFKKNYTAKMIIMRISTMRKNMLNKYEYEIIKSYKI